MFGVRIYDFLFFAIPTATLILFVVGLYRYLSAVNRNKKAPGTFCAEEIKRRKIFLIVVSVIAGALLTVVVGFAALLFMAVAFM